MTTRATPHTYPLTQQDPPFYDDNEDTNTLPQQQQRSRPVPIPLLAADASSITHSGDKAADAEPPTSPVTPPKSKPKPTPPKGDSKPPANDPLWQTNPKSACG
jgi:hypothetical protein